MHFEKLHEREEQRTQCKEASASSAILGNERCAEVWRHGSCSVVTLRCTTVNIFFCSLLLLRDLLPCLDVLKHRPEEDCRDMVAQVILRSIKMVGSQGRKGECKIS